jgi:hypothetical protein
MQLEKISKANQPLMIGALWSLMREAEEDARDSGNGFDKSQVESYYRLWNNVTGDNKVPFWMQVK